MKSFMQALINQDKLVHHIFFQFLLVDLNKILQVSKIWKSKVQEILQKSTNSIKSKFQLKYSHIFLVQQQSYFLPSEQVVLYKTPDHKKINIDILLRIHLKQKYQKTSNIKYTLSYSYQLNQNTKKRLKTSKKRSKKYFWKLQFEFIGEQSIQKQIWMYKDIKNQKSCESDDECLIKEKTQIYDNVPYIMDCQPVRKGQIIEIRLPYCIRNQFIELNKIQFYSIEQQKTVLSTIERFFNVEKKKNECGVQKMYEWKAFDYYKNPISFELDDIIKSYKQQLKMERIYINNLQDHYKIQFECKKELKQSYFMGHKIKILPKLKSERRKERNEEQVVVELKRKGLYEQKQRRLCFRVGDRLKVYLCGTKDD